MAVLKFELVTKDDDINQYCDCGVESINQIIKESYYATLAQHAYAYRISADDKILGYVQYLFRDVELDYFPPDISGIDPGIKDHSLSAVHINYLAIDKKYQNKNHKRSKGIGTVVLETMIKKIEELAEEWPISMITIDARNDLVSWYEREGFHQLRKDFPGQEGYNVAMYYNCLLKQEELTAYLEDSYY